VNRQGRWAWRAQDDREASRSSAETASAIFSRTSAGSVTVGYSKPPPRPERRRNGQSSRLALLSKFLGATPSILASSRVVYASLISLISSPHKIRPGLCRSGERPAWRLRGIRRCAGCAARPMLKWASARSRQVLAVAL